MKTSAFCSRHRLLLAAIAAGALAAQAPRARAALAAADQSNTVGGQTFSNGASTGAQANVVGESFTPASAVMNAVTLSLEDYTTASASTVTLNVYAGAGFAGTLLGTSAPVTFSNTSLATVEFDLAAPLTLTLGSTYTLALSLAAYTGILSQFSSANPYAGGTFYFGGGSISAWDLVFAEGVNSASLLPPPANVPEPSSWALLGVGVAGLGVAALRRRRVRAA